MRDQFQPGVTEARRFCRAQDVQGMAERRQYLEVDSLEHRLGCAQLQEEHDEDPVIRQLLEVGAAYLVILQQHTRYNTKHLIQKIDLGVCIGGIARVLHQERYQPYERVQRVEALGAQNRGRGSGLGNRAVTEIDAHLRAQLEESRDQIVGFQDPVNVHLMHKYAERFRGVARVLGTMVHLHPFAQQVFRLLHQPGWIVKVTSLYGMVDQNCSIITLLITNQFNHFISEAKTKNLSGNKESG